MVSVLMAVVAMTTAASGSSFSYSAAVAVAITTDVAAAAAAAAVAMIAAAAKSGLTTIYKRDIGQNDCPISAKSGQQEQFCWYFFTENQ